MTSHDGVVQVPPAIPMPLHLHAAAFVVKNGERLWPAAEAIDAAKWLAAHSFGIMGGEVYQKHEVGWGTYVRDWSTTPLLGPDEAWPAFVARASAQAVEFLSGDLRRSPSRMLYFLASCREDEARAG